jgi:putative hydrolase of the HAD superfamily
MIKALTFDLWNTLIADDHADYSKRRIAILLHVCEQQQCFRDVSAVRAAYQSATRLWEECWRVKRKGISIQELVNHIFAALNIHLKHTMQDDVVTRFAGVVLDDPPPMLDYASSVLEVLHTKYSIGLICDTGFTPGQVLKQVLERHNMLRYFSCLLFSDEVGATKPSALIFQKALDDLAMNPHEVAHVGNLLETDVVGAKAIGMTAVWVNRGEGGDPNRISYRPDHEIKHLYDLIHIF